MTISPGWSLPAPKPAQCYLCGEFAKIEDDPRRPGRKRQSVEQGSVRWMVPEDHEGEYGSISRCHDHDACRIRALAMGLVWEVNDGYASPVPRPYEGPGPVVPPSPSEDDESSIWDAP